MFTRTKKLAAALALGSAVVLAPGSWVHAQGTQQTADGLVNVQVGDVTVARNVAVEAVAGIVANVCPAIDVSNVALLASQIDQQGGRSAALCNATTEGTTGPVTILDNPGGGGGQANNQDADGLVNVQVGNVTVLENVAVAAAVDLVANVCPAVDVSNVAVLATEVAQRGGSSGAICNGTAEGATGPIRIVNSR